MKRHEFDEVRPGLSKCRLCGLEAKTFDNGPGASPRHVVRYRDNGAGQGGKFKGDVAWASRMPLCR